MRGLIRSWAAAAVTAVCVVAVVTACSDDEPPPTNTSTPSVSDTSTTTPATIPTPTLPAAAKADKAGAEAFVRYFWDVFNYTYMSGDTKLLRSISDKDCKFCTSVATHVEGLTAKGSVTRGAQVTVHQVIAPPADPGDGFPVFTLVSQGAGEVIAKNGSVEASSPAEARQRSDVRVQWVGDAWRMFGVSFGGPLGVP